MRHAIDLKKAKPEKLTGDDNFAVVFIIEPSTNVQPSAFLVKPVFKARHENNHSLSGSLDFLKLLEHKKILAKVILS